MNIKTMGAGILLKRIVPLCGAATLVYVLIAPPPDGLSAVGWHTLGILVLMASLWVSEAIPFAVTAMLPLVFFPMLGICGITTTAAPFANPVIFLFFGGMLIAQGMQSCHLHTRLAFFLLRLAGTRQSSILAAFLLASAGLSMWISNTAVALIMLPIAVSAISLFREGSGKDFAAALVLSVAYGSSIGGMATLVGTPSNAIFAGFMQESYGIRISFPLWMAMSLPISLILLLLAWGVLTRGVFRFSGRIAAGAKFLDQEKLPRLGVGGMGVIAVFAISVGLWIARGFLETRLPWLSDAGIAMAGGLVLFFLPSDSPSGGTVLNAETLKKIPIDVLLLIGGGLSLAAAMQSSGLALWIGGLGSHIGHFAPPLLLAVISIVTIGLAEFTSNTATTAAFLPVASALAVGLGFSPVALSMAVTLASSCGFMLPVSTPPNAIVYGSGHVSLPQMLRAGLIMNIGAWFLVSLWFGCCVPRLFAF
jgi:sodium-dependent dicarboxylate transporter 2/3/5